MTQKAPRKPTRPGKKAWQRPQIKSGKLFESNSLACGKNPSIGQEACMQFFQVS